MNFEDMLNATSNRDDEQALICHAMSLAVEDKSVLEKVMPNDFRHVPHPEIWRIARSLHMKGKRVSPNTVLSEAGLSEGSSMYRAINAAVERPVRAVQARQATDSVVELSKRRQLMTALETAQHRAFESEEYDEGLHFAVETLDGLAGVRVPDTVIRFADALPGWQERMAQSQDHRRVFPTPWPKLNDIIGGGLQAGRSYVVGARPGGGKSLAGANLAQYAAEHGHPSIIFSLEMDQNEVVSRALAAGANAEYGQITRREIDEFNYGRITNYIAEYRDMPLYIVDKANVSMDMISRTCRAVKRKHGLDVVFVDYLQLLDSVDSNISRERQVAMISRSLKILSRELDCAVITACQLNRNSANENRPPRQSDLRESGAIEQDADVLVLLHTDAKDRPGEVDLIVEKNRIGKKQTVIQEWAGHKAAIR